MEILLLGGLSAAAFIIIMVKTGKVFSFERFGWQTDVVISVILAAIFFGTFSGMIVALIAGIFISGFLFLVKLISPPKK